MTAMSEYFAASLNIPSEHIDIAPNTRRQLLVVTMITPGEYDDWQPEGLTFESFLPEDLQAALVARLNGTAESALQWLSPVLPDYVTLTQPPDYRFYDKCFDLYEPVRAIAFQAQVISYGMYSAILALFAFAICIPAALLAMYFAGGRVGFRPAVPVVIPPPFEDGAYGPGAASEAAVIAERLSRARSSRVVYEI
jgi:hypothetical protein